MRVIMGFDHLQYVRNGWRVQYKVPPRLWEAAGVKTLTAPTGIKGAKDDKAAQRKARDASHNIIADFQSRIKGWEAELRNGADADSRYYHPPSPGQPFSGGIKKYPPSDDRLEVNRLYGEFMNKVNGHYLHKLGKLDSDPLLGSKPGGAVEYRDMLKAYAQHNGLVWHDDIAKCHPSIRSMDMKWGRFFDYLRDKHNQFGTDLALITADHLFGYKDRLVQQMAEQEIKSKTVADHLSGLKSLLRFCVEEKRTLTTHPGRDVHFKGKTDPRDKYQDFSPEEVSRILLAAREAPPFVRWFHWLAAYSGARLCEVAEARARDVELVDGVWVFHIRLLHRPRQQRVKTDVSERPVPIHQAVLDEGFLSYVESVRREHGEDAALFPALKLDRDGRFKVDANKTSMAWLREVVGITEPKKVNHSWRHTVKTLFRHHMEEQFADKLTGHANGSVGREYGQYPYPLLAKQVGNVPTWAV